MIRTIPSRSALIAFEAAARHQSFTSAAAELALTESAISRQVAALENQLKLKLFNRIKKRVTLTKAGLLYSKQVRKSLVQMEQDMTNIMAHGGTREILELAVLPTFCSQWLVPRIGCFYQRHPDITINMSARSGMFLFRDTTFDAAIHFGQPTWPGAVADYLFKEDVVAVCTPGLLNQKQLVCVEEMLSYPLLHLSSRADSWRHWFQSAGVLESSALQGGRYEHFAILISAARAGLGLALIPRFLIEKELERMELVIALDQAQQSDDAYYLVCPEENSTNSALNCFRSWLLEEVGSFQ